MARKSNGWIHGGKYVKPTSQHGATSPSAGSTPARKTKRARPEEETVLSEICKHVINLVHHLLPILATLIKTVVTFVAILAGGVICGIETMRNKATNINSPQRPQQNKSQSVPQPRTRSTPSPPMIHKASPSNNNSNAQPPSSQRATPAKSLLRVTSSGSRRDSFGSKEPRSARRVLFSETSEGEVSRTEVLYDKELPASARKVTKETRESLEARVAAANAGRRQSYSPSALVCDGQSPATNWKVTSENQTNNSPLNGNQMRNVTVTNPRSPLATVKVHTSPVHTNNPNKTQCIVNKPNISSSLAIRDTTNRKRSAVTKITNPDQKRRNLIASSRYNRPTISGYNRLGYRTGVSNGLNSKRQREEMEDWVWKAMNKKKGKVVTDESVIDSKTPLKARV